MWNISLSFSKETGQSFHTTEINYRGCFFENTITKYISNVNQQIYLGNKMAKKGLKIKFTEREFNGVWWPFR